VPRRGEPDARHLQSVPPAPANAQVLRTREAPSPLRWASVAARILHLFAPED